MIKIAIAVQYKVQVLSSQTIKLKEKMEEIRIVNRAKMLLMQNKEMSEQEAHRFLEKQAIFSPSLSPFCIQNRLSAPLKRIAVADEIIKTYS